MEKYIPDIYQKSIYTIDYSKLLSRGIKCLLFDLDNTIIAINDKTPPQKAKDLFVSLKQKGFKVIIFSNSPKIRVKQFQNFFGVDCYHSARKPHPGKFRKLLKAYNYTVNEVAIIGDQLLTDIVGGNKIGITTVLVNPLSDEDIIFTKLNRFLEKRKMKKLRDKNLFCQGRYYD